MSDDHELRLLALGATPGPWEWLDETDAWHNPILQNTEMKKEVLCSIDTHQGSHIIGKPEDMAFIAAANPKRILGLLEDLSDERVMRETEHVDYLDMRKAWENAKARISELENTLGTLGETAEQTKAEKP